MYKAASEGIMNLADKFFEMERAQALQVHMHTAARHHHQHSCSCLPALDQHSCGCLEVLHPQLSCADQPNLFAILMHRMQQSHPICHTSCCRCHV